MQNRRISILAVFSVILLVAGVSFAATINSTTVAGNQITIGGVGFEGILTVTVNSQKLTIISSTPTQIIATMNPVFPVGTYRLLVKVGSKSATGTVTIPSSSIVVAQCFRAYSNATGLYATVWLLGDQPCDQGANYPPYGGVPFPGGVLGNLMVRGAFTGTATVFVNYSPTTLSCSITDNPPNNESTCSDLADQVTLNAGDELNLGIIPSVTGGISNVRVTFEFQGQ